MTADVLRKIDLQLNRIPLYQLAVRYRLHVSILFMLMTMVSFLPYLSGKGMVPVIAFFCWHFALYVYNRYTDREEDNLNNPNEALDEFHSHIALWLTLGLLAGGLLMLVIAGYEWIYYLASLPFVFLYGQPLLGGRFRIKKITIVKNVYAALCCWCLPFTLLYLTYGGSFPPPKYIIYANVQLFLIVSIFELFWDIRDIDGDRRAGVMTIPVRFGVTVTKALILLAIVLGFAGKFLMYGALDWRFAVYYTVFLFLLRKDSPAFMFHLMIFGQIASASALLFILSRNMS